MRSATEKKPFEQKSSGKSKMKPQTNTMLSFFDKAAPVVTPASSNINPVADVDKVPSPAPKEDSVTDTYVQTAPKAAPSDTSDASLKVITPLGESMLPNPDDTYQRLTADEDSNSPLRAKSPAETATLVATTTILIEDSVSIASVPHDIEPIPTSTPTPTPASVPVNEAPQAPTPPKVTEDAMVVDVDNTPYSTSVGTSADVTNKKKKKNESNSTKQLAKKRKVEDTDAMDVDGGATDKTPAKNEELGDEAMEAIRKAQARMTMASQALEDATKKFDHIFDLGEAVTSAMDALLDKAERCNSSDEFEEDLLDIIARKVEGRSETLAAISELVVAALTAFLERIQAGSDAGGCSLLATELIRLCKEDGACSKLVSNVATRKAMGPVSPAADVYEDPTVSSLWRWEVRDMDRLGKANIKATKTARNLVDKYAKCLKQDAEVEKLCKKKTFDGAKIDVAKKKRDKVWEDIKTIEEKMRKEKRVQRLKDEAALKKKEEAQKKKDEAAAAKEKKQVNKGAKALSKAVPTKGLQSLGNFFSGLKPGSSTGMVDLTNSSAGSSATAAAPRTPAAGTFFSLGTGTGSGCRSGPQFKKKSKLFSNRAEGPIEDSMTTDFLKECAQQVNLAQIMKLRRKASADLLKNEKVKQLMYRSRRSQCKLNVTTSDPNQQVSFGEAAYAVEREISVDGYNRILKFHHDHRPAYVGTWSKGSTIVSGRNPFGKDTKLRNYDWDSEEEWESDCEGEDIMDSDGEDDGEEGGNELEYNEFFLQDNDFGSDVDSDGEERAAVKLARRKTHHEDLGVRFIGSSGKSLVFDLAAEKAATLASEKAAWEEKEKMLKEKAERPKQTERPKILPPGVKPPKEHKNETSPSKVAVQKASIPMMTFTFSEDKNTERLMQYAAIVHAKPEDMPYLQVNERKDVGFFNSSLGANQASKRTLVQEMPQQLMPNLIRFVHGKTDTKELVAKWFIYFHQDKLTENHTNSVKRNIDRIAKKVRGELLGKETGTRRWVVDPEVLKNFNMSVAPKALKYYTMPYEERLTLEEVLEGEKMGLEDPTGVPSAENAAAPEEQEKKEQAPVSWADLTQEETEQEEREYMEFEDIPIYHVWPTAFTPPRVKKWRPPRKETVQEERVFRSARQRGDTTDLERGLGWEWWPEFDIDKTGKAPKRQVNYSDEYDDNDTRDSEEEGSEAKEGE